MSGEQEPVSVIAHRIAGQFYPAVSLNYRPLYIVIEAAILAERGRWISVAKQPPEHGRNVLVCHGKSVSEGYIGRYDRWYDGPGRPIPVPEWWQPLPAPPESNMR